MLILVGLYIKAGADMTGADMPGADLAGADMPGADLAIYLLPKCFTFQT
jgi:uncharacterized protein YjbI with pentapeptide repeats